MIQLAKPAAEESFIVNKYLEEIVVYEPLSSVREKELSLRINSGDESARRELAEANLRFVVFVAKQFQNRGLSMAELISVGNMGLLRAVEKFDGARGTKFISYAVWWIRQAMHQAIAEIRIIPVPLRRRQCIKKVVLAAQKITQSSGQEASWEAVGRATGLTEAEVAEAFADTSKLKSLDAFFGVDREDALARLADENMPPPDKEVETASSRQAVELALAVLDKRERLIVRRYYGLRYEARSLDQIGVELGLTRERVRQLKERAIRKLRRVPVADTVL